ncbi:MAG: threonine--tRNA ligase, partial [Clostridiaceae bacterium]|nr:threonine--tRNA ligase [Clostridiaceae bacterium]
FTTVDYIGQGLPILLPKGAKLFQILSRFVEDEEERRGYLITRTPMFARSALYKISGHWDHYRDNMFIIGDETEQDGEAMALRPMTCPFQFQTFLTETRSYRDLPMRLAETATLFRNESSGEMHGLIRLRQFTISEGHLIVTPEQLETEFDGCLDLARFMLRNLGLDDDVSYRFSKWDENDRGKYIGEPEEWDRVQNLMRGILVRSGIDFEEADGEAAFYGPKLDIQIRNVFGKEDTLITIQIDFQLAEKFGMKYSDADGELRYPYIIHRTSVGCYERTIALLLEKHKGVLPLWLAPEQVRILAVADRHNEAVEKFAARFRAAGLRVKTDLRDEKVGRKIRDAQVEKVPYTIVVGDREIEEDQLAARSRRHGQMEAQPADSLIKMLVLESERREV